MTEHTHSGACNGMCFSKKNLPSTPSGNRFHRQRPLFDVREDDASYPHVVVDQLTLGEATAGEQDLVEVRDRQLSPPDGGAGRRPVERS